MKTFMDKITHKTIAFNDTDIFTIKTKAGNNNYIIRKVFNASDIAKAIDEFYALLVLKGTYKYLFKHPEGRHHHKGELVLRMRGESDTIPVEDLVLKPKREFVQYDKTLLANLINCPRTLHEKISGLNRANFPASSYKWSNQKIIYCLVTYFTELSDAERYEILKKSEPIFLEHKVLSGQPKSEVSVDVVKKDDLL